jgi:hypothetical protein
MKMSPKKIALIVLTVFVAVSIGYLVYSETREAQPAETGIVEQEKQDEEIAGNTALASDEKQAIDRIVRVYYFHTTFRCPTCHKIEEYTKNTILSTFGPELKKGTIVWKALNVEEPQNRHFTDDYKLFTKSVVVVDEQKGKQVRWKVLDKTWELVHDQSAFADYIRGEVKKYMEGA